MGRIPDRWKEYTPCGKPICNVPVVAFKTPLTHKFSIQHGPECEFVNTEERFTPDDLVANVASLGHKMVVVIDLTNTFRYYDGARELQQSHGVQYEKVKCEGQKVPNDEVMNHVAAILNDVIHRHGRDGKYVAGIHCTHGVNRTGYLVARYLVEWLGYEVDAAVNTVGEARGYKIEREKYLEDLQQRTPGHRYDEWSRTQPEPTPCQEEKTFPESSLYQGEMFINGYEGPDVCTDSEKRGNKRTNNFHPYNNRGPKGGGGHPGRNRGGQGHSGQGYRGQAYHGHSNWHPRNRGYSNAHYTYHRSDVDVGRTSESTDQEF